MRRPAGAAVVLACAMALSACTPSPPAVPPTTVLGRTMDALDGIVPEAATLLVQDASTAVVAHPPSYDPGMFPDGASAWLLLAICSADDADLRRTGAVEVAVIPAADATAAIAAKARRNGFTDLVDCADVGAR